MLNNLGLGILLYAKDGFSAVFARMNSSFLNLQGQSQAFVDKMQSNASQLKVGLGMMAVGMTGLAGSFVLADKAAKFEGQLANLKVISGASAKEMDTFKTAIIGADKSMFGPTATASALREIAQLGFTAAQTLEMLPPVLNLATASLGELGITDAAAIAAQAIKAFGLTAKDTTAIVDKMAKISNISALSFRDLPIGVGVMSRGAGTMKQSFDEALITLALVRNTIPTIERASHAATIAMERLGGGRHAKDLQKVVDVFDKGTGKVRPFLDVIVDLMPKMAKMSDKESIFFLQKAFGAEGMAGINAVMQQLTTGITKTTGEILKGADAVAWMRKNMKELSEGTAAIMTEAQMNTFDGQMKLLKANFERLQVVLGEPFMLVLRPLVEGFSKFVTWVKNAFVEIPANVKKAIGTFILLASTVLTVVGALIAVKAIFVLFGATFSVIAGVAASMVVPLAAIAGAIGLAVLMFAALKVHSEQTGHGVFGFFADLGRKGYLVFQGLMQLFKEGAFSGAVMVELNKAENSGVKSFAIKVWLWINRIKNFLVGLVHGFRERVRELEPVFTRLADVLGFVASMFGLNVGAANENRNAWENAGHSGSTLGQTLADVAGIIANAMSIALLAGVTVANAISAAWDAVGPVVGTAALIMWSAVQLVVGILGGDWDIAWRGAFGLVYGLIDMAISLLGRLYKIISFFPTRLAGLLGIDLGFTKGLDKFLAESHASIAGYKAEALNLVGVKGQSKFGFPPQPVAPTVNNSPALASVGSYSHSLGRPSPEAPPAALQTLNINTTLKTSQEVLARLVQQAGYDKNSRSFRMVMGTEPAP